LVKRVELNDMEIEDKGEGIRRGGRSGSFPADETAMRKKGKRGEKTGAKGSEKSICKRRGAINRKEAWTSKWERNAWNE